ADTLFHENATIGTPDYVVLDEAFWSKQLRGIDDAERFIMPFDRMRKHDHGRLADNLDKQLQTGGLQRQYIYGLQNLTSLIIEEYKRMPDIGLIPGMSKREIKALRKKSKIDAAIYSKRIILILKELRRMYEDQDIEV